MTINTLIVLAVRTSTHISGRANLNNFWFSINFTVIFHSVLENMVFEISGLNMKDTALYEQLLGLKSPWSIKKVDLSLLAEQRVVVEVILNKGQVWADPTDATKMAHVNGLSLIHI